MFHFSELHDKWKQYETEIKLQVTYVRRQLSRGQLSCYQIHQIHDIHDAVIESKRKQLLLLFLSVFWSFSAFAICNRNHLLGLFESLILITAKKIRRKKFHFTYTTDPLIRYFLDVSLAFFYTEKNSN